MSIFIQRGMTDFLPHSPFFLLSGCPLASQGHVPAFPARLLGLEPSSPSCSSKTSTPVPFLQGQVRLTGATPINQSERECQQFIRAPCSHLSK